MQMGFTALTTATLARSASSEQLRSWGGAASAGQVALQRQSQVSHGVPSAHLSGGGAKGVARCRGGSPRRWPRFPRHGSVLAAGVSSVHGAVLMWGTLSSA